MKKLNLKRPMFHKTSHPGVLYITSNRTGKEERLYYIRYRDADGNEHFEKAGPLARK